MATVALNDAADFGDRIQDAGGRFTMNDGDVRDGFVRRQRAIQRGGVVRSVFRRAKDEVIYFQMLQHQHDAFAIGAVGKDRHLAARRHARGEDGLDAKRAAALQENGLPAGVARESGDFEDFLAHPIDLRVELEVPRTGVVQHRLLHRQARGERAGREQQFVARGRQCCGGLHKTPLLRTALLAREGSTASATGLPSQTYNKQNVFIGQFHSNERTRNRHSTSAPLPSCPLFESKTKRAWAAHTDPPAQARRSFNTEGNTVTVP